MALGFRIGADPRMADPSLLARFSALPVSCISDCMKRLVAGGARLRPIGTASFCGVALTVRTAPGDNLMVHKALDVARRGHVIVVDAGGDLTNAIVGERMVTLAASRGVVALVINGAIRDVAAIRAHPMPVFAAGVTHRGPYKNGPGEINYPIAIDGMVVEPGDIIVGDDDGLVCIPIRDALSVCADAERKSAFERATDPITEDRSWIDASLRQLGCEFQSSAGNGVGDRTPVAKILRGPMAHLTTIDHIDIVVEDPKRMADFLVSIGFTFKRKTEGARGSYEVAFPGEGDQPVLELTPADNGDGKKRALGLRHIAVRSTDIHRTFEELTKRGYTFDKPPRPIPDTGRLLTNLKDPEGKSLQIVDSPS